MKLTDFLSGPAARHVQYYPQLVPILGSVNATILFGQFLYWRGKQADPDGWLFKNQKEIQNETGLSREEQETARKKLRKISVLHEQRRGNPCRLWFLLDLDRVNDLWEKHQQNQEYGQIPQAGMRENRKLDCGNAPNKSAGTPQTITAIDYNIDDNNNHSQNVVDDLEIQKILSPLPICEHPGLMPLVRTALEVGYSISNIAETIQLAKAKSREPGGGLTAKMLRGLATVTPLAPSHSNKTVNEERQIQEEQARQQQAKKLLEALSGPDRESIMKQAAEDCRQFGSDMPQTIQARAHEIVLSQNSFLNLNHYEK